MRKDQPADVIKSERSRGKHPKHITTIQNERLLRHLQTMLEDERFDDERAYLQAIREAGIKDGSEKFLRLAELWQAKKRPGGRPLK